MPDQPHSIHQAKPDRRTFLVILPLLLLVVGCQSSGVGATSVPSSTMPPAVSSTSTTPSTATTTADNVSTERFSVSVGVAGVTYEVDGDPPSGPSSFAVLGDGSVVIADTMALDRGEPRLLHYDRTGALLSIMDLAKYEVAAIADVVSDGSRLAVLDIYLPMNRYRVVYLSTTGDVEEMVEIPNGYHLEDGLTGLAWDDAGVLLEFELGASYARIGDLGEVEPMATPVFHGFEVEIVDGEGRETNIRVGESAWTAERSTDLGGGTLIGLSANGTLAVVLDEVDTTGPAFEVLRRVQIYSLQGELVAEAQVDAGEQHVEIMRPFELGADGGVIYLAAKPDHVEINPLTEAVND